MFNIYDKKEDIPEGYRDDYVQRSDGKWEPKVEGINSLSGLLAKKEELEGKVSNHAADKRQLESQHAKAIRELKAEHATEIQTLETAHAAKVTELEGQVRVPDDKALVTKEQAEAIPKYEALGKPDELTAMKEKHDTLVAKEAAEQKLLSFEKIGKTAKIPNAKAFAALAVQHDLKTETTIITEKGKDPVEQISVIEPDGTKRLLTLDYLKDDDRFAPFAESLAKKTDEAATNGGDNGRQTRKHLRQDSAETGTTSKTGEIFDDIREKHKDDKPRTASTLGNSTAAARLGRP